MTLSTEQNALHARQKQDMTQAANFMRALDVSQRENNGVAIFDNISTDVLPDSLLSIFDGILARGGSEGDKHHILNAINVGRKMYRERNGGEDPTPLMIAAALGGAASLFIKDPSTQFSAFDGLKVDGYDNFNVDHHEAISIVPAMTVVTIATAIANSLAIVAMLPNPIGSNEVPVVYARMTADKDWGGFSKGDFLDGEKASFGYVENRPSFAMALDAGTTFKVTPHVKYLSFADKTPDVSSSVAPFQGGRVSIRVNGIEVAHDRSRANTKKSGITTLQPVQGVSIAGTAVSVTSATANLDTHLITVTFAAALPAGAVVKAHVVFDFERTDGNGNTILKPPSVDLATEYASVFASASRAQVQASIDAITQMAQELGVGFMGGALALIQNKYYFEQTLRLLSEGKERAEVNGRVYEFDMARGTTSDLAAGFNATPSLMQEVRKSLNLAKLKINQQLGTNATTFDLYVNDRGAIFMKMLTDDVFDETQTGFATNTQIVRIGAFKDGTNVYHVPSTTGLLDDEEGTTEMELVARNGDPAKAPFVGHMPVPPMVQTAQVSPFSTLIGVYSRVAADLNPLSRFADQIAVIKVINMPVI